MTDEDYLPCSSYENQQAHAAQSGFAAFFNEEASLYFFSLLDADGKVLLKSEGYPQQAARENGIQSVIKNRVNKDFYSVKSEDGKYYLSLRAANYREIARSCTVDSEAAALALIPYASGEQVRGGAIAAAIAPKERANDKIDDDYLACKEYEGKPEVGADGLVKFTHESGQHYFAWYDDDNSLLMRSEGYPTTAARDNGMASVAKNRELEERYSTIEKIGRHFTILKAGNHQEIARSCSFDSAAAAMSLYPSARARAAEEKAAALAAAAAAAVPVAAVVAETESKRRDDNYLACDEYVGHGESDANGIVKWQHSDGEYYFSWMNADGSVKMRSEGYPTTAARDNGADSVLRNRDNEARYGTIDIGSKHFVILKAGNHQEIARSCVQDTPFVFASWLAPAAIGAAFLVPEVAEAAPDVKSMAPLVEVTPDVEDDYMPCREYEGRNINDKMNNVALFKHDNGQYYFAVYNADGSVRLRSEGFRTGQDRDKELSGVLKNLNNEEMYSVLKRGEYYIRILKDKTGREVGRSCLLKEEPMAVVVPPVVPPVAAVAAVAAAAAIIPNIELPKVEPKVVVPPPPVYTAAAPIEEEVAAAAGGFNWWWLLPLLLLPLLWFIWKGCNKETATAETPAVTAIPPVLVDTVKSITPAAAPVTQSCNLEWIFFDFDKSDLRSASQAELDKLASILKENPDYVAVLKANTDFKGSDAYNEALSTRRASNSKAYLVKKGIDGARIKTTMNGEKDPIAKNAIGNKDTEQGRQFNRRVELYVQDKTGKNICESISPAVPADLQVK